MTKAFETALWIAHVLPPSRMGIKGAVAYEYWPSFPQAIIHGEFAQPYSSSLEYAITYRLAT